MKNGNSFFLSPVRPNPPSFFRVLRPVNHDAMLLAWTLPELDEFGRSNGLPVRGYKVQGKMPGVGGGGVLSYMGYIGMCRCEGYGFQAVYYSIGYINQSIWV